MKFNENGKVIGFEVGDVFDDPDEVKYVILHANVPKLEIWKEPTPLIILQRCSDKKLLIVDSALLEMRFNGPYPQSPGYWVDGAPREHFYQFKYNIIDESNKSVKVKFSFEMEV